MTQFIMVHACSCPCLIEILTLNIFFHPLSAFIVIGWESPVYNVSEGSGQVEICAVITTPPSDVELQIGDFNLAVSTEDVTAG